MELPRLQSVSLGTRQTTALANIQTGVATYLLIWPADGMMRKEDIRGIYDGSIFYKKAEEAERKKRGRAASKKLH